MTNIEFYQSIHVIAQLVSTQAECGVFGIVSSKDIRVLHFIRLNPPIFTGFKVKEDPQFFGWNGKNLQVHVGH